jgi:hypothetical protein
MTGAYDRNARMGDGVHISTHIKDQRRIVDLFEFRGIRRIVKADN